MVKCKKCGLEFSEPIIEFHKEICQKNKRNVNNHKEKDEKDESEKEEHC